MDVAPFEDRNPGSEEVHPRRLNDRLLGNGRWESWAKPGEIHRGKMEYRYGLPDPESETGVLIDVDAVWAERERQHAEKYGLTT